MLIMFFFLASCSKVAIKLLIMFFFLLAGCSKVAIMLLIRFSLLLSGCSKVVLDCSSGSLFCLLVALR
jgi:hypothetical protein